MVAKKYKYVCSFCGRPFSRAEHRNRHQLSHTNEKAFACSLCKSAFVRKDLLLRHVRTVHAKARKETVLRVVPLPLAPKATCDNIYSDMHPSMQLCMDTPYYSGFVDYSIKGHMQMPFLALHSVAPGSELYQACVGLPIDFDSLRQDLSCSKQVSLSAIHLSILYLQQYLQSVPTDNNNSSNIDIIVNFLNYQFPFLLSQYELSSQSLLSTTQNKNQNNKNSIENLKPSVSYYQLWQNTESLKRTIFIIYILLTNLNIWFNVPMVIGVQQLHNIIMPCLNFTTTDQDHDDVLNLDYEAWCLSYSNLQLLSNLNVNLNVNFGTFYSNLINNSNNNHNYNEYDKSFGFKIRILCCTIWNNMNKIPTNNEILRTIHTSLFNNNSNTNIKIKSKSLLFKKILINYNNASSSSPSSSIFNKSYQYLITNKSSILFNFDTDSSSSSSSSVMILNSLFQTTSSLISFNLNFMNWNQLQLSFKQKSIELLYSSMLTIVNTNLNNNDLLNLQLFLFNFNNNNSNNENDLNLSSQLQLQHDNDNDNNILSITSQFLFFSLIDNQSLNIILLNENLSSKFGFGSSFEMIWCYLQYCLIFICYVYNLEINVLKNNFQEINDKENKIKNKIKNKNSNSNSNSNSITNDLKIYNDIKTLFKLNSIINNDNNNHDNNNNDNNDNNNEKYNFLTIQVIKEFFKIFELFEHSFSNFKNIYKFINKSLTFLEKSVFLQLQYKMDSFNNYNNNSNNMNMNVNVNVDNNYINNNNLKRLRSNSISQREMKKNRNNNTNDNLNSNINSTSSSPLINVINYDQYPINTSNNNQQQQSPIIHDYSFKNVSVDMLINKQSSSNHINNNYNYTSITTPPTLNANTNASSNSNPNSNSIADNKYEHYIQPLLNTSGLPPFHQLHPKNSAFNVILPPLNTTSALKKHSRSNSNESVLSSSPESLGSNNIYHSARSVSSTSTSGMDGLLPLTTLANVAHNHAGNN